MFLSLCPSTELNAKLFNYCLELCLDIKFIYNLRTNIFVFISIRFAGRLDSENVFWLLADLEMELNV